MRLSLLAMITQLLELNLNRLLTSWRSAQFRKMFSESKAVPLQREIPNHAQLGENRSLLLDTIKVVKEHVESKDWTRKTAVSTAQYPTWGKTVCDQHIQVWPGSAKPAYSNPPPGEYRSFSLTKNSYDLTKNSYDRFGVEHNSKPGFAHSCP